MKTYKYMKVIAIGLFSLGCGGGASLEEVEELRQEIAALRKQVESLEDTVRTKHLEIVNDDGNVVVKAEEGWYGHGLLYLKNKEGRVVIRVEASETGNGKLKVNNKIGLAAVYLYVDELRNLDGAVEVLDDHAFGKILTPNGVIKNRSLFDPSTW